MFKRCLQDSLSEVRRDSDRLSDALQVHKVLPAEGPSWVQDQLHHAPRQLSLPSNQVERKSCF